MTHPHHVPEHGDHEERRSLERRVFELERQLVKLVTTTAITDVKVDGLISTMDSRMKAFDRGQELILNQLKPLAAFDLQKLDRRVEELEEVRLRADGAVLLVKILGVTGITGGLIGIIKMLSR